ncbi:hypothetical protein ACF1AE_00020 [Streptomyces sp. NPDC014986]|uniref:hypothetical protein n=1 Tax=Streptomyces sp. NPDC014986 TaxID=3364934 RepID=UPI0036FB9254
MAPTVPAAPRPVPRQPGRRAPGRPALNRSALNRSALSRSALSRSVLTALYLAAALTGLALGTDTAVTLTSFGLLAVVVWRITALHRSAGGAAHRRRGPADPAHSDGTGKTGRHA